MRYISVGRRFAALLLDWIILLVVTIPFCLLYTSDAADE